VRSRFDVGGTTIKAAAAGADGRIPTVFTYVPESIAIQPACGWPGVYADSQPVAR
jgi:hypothetical protein